MEMGGGENMKCKNCNNPNILFTDVCDIDKNSISDIPKGVNVGIRYFCEKCGTYYVYIPYNMIFERMGKYQPRKANTKLY